MDRDTRGLALLIGTGLMLVAYSFGYWHASETYRPVVEESLKTTARAVRAMQEASELVGLPLPCCPVASEAAR